MLYDELVPDGKYLAHYGVPKDQWSPEARARHNRNHPQKADATTDYLFIKNLRRAQDAYDEYRNDNYNRGGHRSTFGSKVDEERARRAEFSRRYEADDRGKRPTNPQKPSQGGSNRVVKPGDGRQPSEVRRRHTSVGSKDPSSYAKPGRSGRSSGSGARMPLGGLPDRDNGWSNNRPRLGNQFDNKKPRSAKSPLNNKVRPTSKGRVNNKVHPTATPASGTIPVSRYGNWHLNSSAKSNPDTQDMIRQLNSVTNALNSGRNLREYSHNGQLVKQNPSFNRVAESVGVAPNTMQISTKGERASSSRTKNNRKTRSKNAHSGGGYSDRANNIYDRPTGHRTLHYGNAGPGSMEQVGANTYRRVDYENRRRRR